MGAAPDRPTDPKREKPGSFDPEAELAGLDLHKMASDEAARARALQEEVEGGNAEVRDELEKANGDLDRLDRLLRTPRPNLDE